MEHGCIEPTRRHTEYPVRLTLASELGDDIDGAWWPYSASMARELPYLVDALRGRLGQVVDIAVNWSSLHGAPDLTPPSSRTLKPLPGQKHRDHRVITVIGTEATANLLVVPSRTAKSLAVMVLRQAAALPIHDEHLGTAACRAATEIVHTARTESAHRIPARPAATP